MSIMMYLLLPMLNPATQRTMLTMGTQLSMHLEPIAAQEAVFQEVKRIEAFGSTWRTDSQWTALNRAEGETRSMDPESFALLEVVQQWSRRLPSFDPVLGTLVRAWGLRTGGRTPEHRELQQARDAAGSRWLILDAAARSVRLGHPRAELEEGGFLKGYALDRAAAAAREHGARRGLLDFGGQILAWGSPRAVQIAGPDNRARPLCTLRLHNASLATSGCGERGRHILDPRTGHPATDWGSVSVVAATGLEADILSTALFVLGPEEGLRWATENHVAALFLTHAGVRHMSPKLQTLAPLFHER